MNFDTPWERTRLGNLQSNIRATSIRQRRQQVSARTSTFKNEEDVQGIMIKPDANNTSAKMTTIGDHNIVDKILKNLVVIRFGNQAESHCKSCICVGVIEGETYTRNTYQLRSVCSVEGYQ
jgi:hypothetical protein